MARVGVLAVALGAAVASATAAADGAAAPPSFVQQALPAAALLGQGQMRFLGLRIYDARLWVGPQFKAADFGDYPLALELSYHRAFKGAGESAVHELNENEFSMMMSRPLQPAPANLIRGGALA